MKNKNKKGFTVIELLISLAIMAMLMTAVAFAFDASVKNYQANQGIYKTLNTARAALLRITNDLRTAQAVALIGSGDPDNSRCSMILADGSDVTYRFSAADNTLYYDKNDTGDSYTLCRNVTAMTFNRATVPDDATAIRSVRISMTLTDDAGENPQTLAAAAVIRKNL